MKFMRLFMIQNPINSSKIEKFISNFYAPNINWTRGLSRTIIILTTCKLQVDINDDLFEYLEYKINNLYTFMTKVNGHPNVYFLKSFLQYVRYFLLRTISQINMRY